MHHSDRGINKIVQFSNIRTQQRIICAQFMFMPPQSPHSSLHKSQELECRDDNIVQATSELQHSWIWYEATFCDKKYPGPGSRNSAPGRLRRPRHAMDNTWARSIITTIVNHLLVKVRTSWQNSVSPCPPWLADIIRSCHDHWAIVSPVLSQNSAW